MRFKAKPQIKRRDSRVSRGRTGYLAVGSRQLVFCSKVLYNSFVCACMRLSLYLFETLIHPIFIVIYVTLIECAMSWGWYFKVSESKEAEVFL
ncbi:hypothetical protein BKA65DRAFT_499380 [Rhexocercosporidium sp. MPI-PUGE-AT-0058]|nr:hypothetical protein BKA65DRAFT_499380 [Rhexocercosporidium sp. MPI-PUGE-AT-0058]